VVVAYEIAESKETDEFFCLIVPDVFNAVSQWFADFTETSD
jgi:predicted phosphoribosyltransferase